MNTINLTPLVVALIGLVGAVVARYLIPYIKAMTTLEQQQNIQTWVRIAVEAAEMIFREAGHGAEKYQYVEKFLIDNGFTLDQQEIKMLIESAVNELKKGVVGLTTDGLKDSAQAMTYDEPKPYIESEQAGKQEAPIDTSLGVKL